MILPKLFIANIRIFQGTFLYEASVVRRGFVFDDKAGTGAFQRQAQGWSTSNEGQRQRREGAAEC